MGRVGEKVVLKMVSEITWNELHVMVAFSDLFLDKSLFILFKWANEKPDMVDSDKDAWWQGADFVCTKGRCWPFWWRYQRDCQLQEILSHGDLLFCFRVKINYVTGKNETEHLLVGLTTLCSTFFLQFLIDSWDTSTPIPQVRFPLYIRQIKLSHSTFNETVKKFHD